MPIRSHFWDGSFQAISCTGSLVLTIKFTTTTRKYTHNQNRRQIDVKKNTQKHTHNNIYLILIQQAWTDLLELRERMIVYNCNTQYSAEQSKKRSFLPSNNQNLSVVGEGESTKVYIVAVNVTISILVLLF